MDSLVYISAAALVFVIIMVFVNARRVSDLRTDVENIPQPEGYTYRDTSIQTAADGTLGPKKYYWLKIASVTPSTKTTATEADKEETAVMVMDTLAKGTDNEVFIDDVKAYRIGSMYRPEDNHLMSVAPLKGGSRNLKIGKLKTSSLKFDNIPDTRYCTVVGLPPSTVGPATA